MRYSLLLLFSVGCSPSFNTVKTFDEENNYYNSENDEYNDFFSQSGLPELRDDMEKHYCDDEFPGAAGAASYFLGTYLQEEEGWIGKERWYLFPTPGWIEAEDEITEEGCYVTWDVDANESECPTCSLTLSVIAGVNRNETNCPEGLWDNPEEEEWEAVYDVDISGEDATFSFQGSGTFIGQGYANSSALSFLSDVTCSWF